MSDSQDAGRERALAAGLRVVHDRMDRACAVAGRDPAELTLVVVTKFFPASDVAALVRLGVGDIGENRDQEAAAKVGQLPDLLGSAPLPRVHFIGQLQTNKAGSVAAYADLVHSVDRLKLARALDRAAAHRGRVLDILLQVNLDADDMSAQGRGGLDAATFERTVQELDALEHLRVRGVMGVAPLRGDPCVAFARLARLGRRLRESHPGADVVSAGMSGDLEAAIGAGATHLRVGSAILGSRPTRG